MRAGVGDTMEFGPRMARTAAALPNVIAPAAVAGVSILHDRGKMK